MTKRLVVTRADDNVSDWSAISHPIIKEYAKRCNADFLILNDETVHPFSHFRILKCYDLLEEYDRILSIDTDVLIMPNCPNIFDVVPEDSIGTVLEDKGSRLQHRRQVISDAQKQFGDVGWREGYLNTGVFVVSREHREIFNISKDRMWMGFGEDDVTLGLKIKELGYKIFELDPYYNFMSLWTENWCGLKKADAYIVHYAGHGFYPNIPRVQQLKQDWELIYNRWWS
jgi:hypothetical protein